MYRFDKTLLPLYNFSSISVAIKREKELVHANH